jgi:flavin reductase (DIM6/NTAB) family NADH-FMN oxidoreductase RutF
MRPAHPRETLTGPVHRPGSARRRDAVPPHDSVRLRQAFGCFPTGVTAVCAMAQGGPAGLAANSFTSVSLDPALVSVCMACASTTWPVLRDLPAVGISVLAESHASICRTLAAKGIDRFAKVSWEASDSGAVFIHGAVLWLECHLEEEFAAGDHAIALLRIDTIRSFPDVAPLVFHRSTFHGLAERIE